MAASAKRQLHLNLFIHGRGHHEAAWRHPSASPLPLTDIRYYTDLARKAEAALFDSVFLADTLAVGDDVARAPRTWLEPITALAALAGATTRIGLIATCSTTYTEPFNLARQFASLDHITGGRVGWNIVTTWLATASSNYGGEGPLDDADRYERAEEHMRVVTGLWTVGQTTPCSTTLQRPVCARHWHSRPTPRRAVLSRGRTAEPAARSAGSAGLCPGRFVETGRRFAARYAEAVFTAQMEKATARDFYADLKTAAASAGRAPEHVLILPGLSPVIGATEAEAQRLARELNDLSDPEVGRKRLSGRFGGHDFSHLRLDATLTPEDFPDPGTVEAARAHRGDHRPGASGETHLAAVAGLPGRCPWPLRDRRHA